MTQSPAPFGFSPAELRTFTLRCTVQSGRSYAAGSMPGSFAISGQRNQGWLRSHGASFRVRC